MGGKGSGQYGTGGKLSKVIVEDTFTLDINKIKKALKPGSVFTYSWKYRIGTLGKLQTNEIRIHALRNSLIITYPGTGEPFSQRVGIAWAKCHYGGKRPVFVCPKCSKKVFKLHERSKLFLCRKCHGLTYWSCQTSKSTQDRLTDIYRRLREMGRKLEIEDFKPYENNSALLIRPRGMHRTTFFKLQLQLMNLETERNKIWIELGNEP